LSHAKSVVTVVGGLILLGSAALASSAQPASDAQINEQVAGALRQVEPNLARRVQVDTKNEVRNPISVMQ